MNKQNAQFKNGRQVYLLRCWQEPDGTWRYVIEVVNAQNGSRQGFSDLAELLVFLKMALPK
ncbi:MAG: hypothetical protein QNJ45_15750 [Ardenticatenaceae bacterium]|nr:hypothetical protein [Ardenticatenaceae bacterium]